MESIPLAAIRWKNLHQSRYSNCLILKSHGEDYEFILYKTKFLHEFSKYFSETVANKISVNSNKKTRMLVRLLNGETLSKVFNATDKLYDVLLWIQLHTATEQFDLMTNFPKKVYTEDDYEQSLDELHLVPSAVVIVTEPDKWNNLKEYRGITTEDENRQVEEDESKKSRNRLKKWKKSVWRWNVFDVK